MADKQRHLVVMSDEEIDRFLVQSRTATLATWGPEGFPHQVAMWYGLVDGHVCFASKAKAQKVQNLRRDPRIGVMIEAGDSYAELRGVAIEGRAEMIESAEHDTRFRSAGVSLYERYTGPFLPTATSRVDEMLHNRVVVVVRPERVRSWDHRKMGGNRSDISGSTARFLHMAGAPL